MSKIIFTFVFSAVIFLASNISFAEDEIKVGVVLGLTGPAHLYSEKAKQGIELALEEINSAGGINGKQIKLIYEDSKTDPKTAATAFTKLVTQDEVVAAIGGIWSITAPAIGPLAKRFKKLFITAGVFDTEMSKDNPYYFTLSPHVKTIYAPTKRYLELNPQIKSIATHVFDSSWGHTYENTWLQVANELGVKVVDQIRYLEFNPDFRVDALRLKKKNPDAIFVTYHQEVLMQRFREIKFNSKIFTTDDIYEAIYVRNLSFDLAQGMSFADWNPSKAFKESFRKKFNAEPFLAPQNYYEGLRSLAKALEIDEKDPGKSIRQVAYQGVSGKIDFSKGNAANFAKAGLYKVKNKDFEIIQ